MKLFEAIFGYVICTLGINKLASDPRPPSPPARQPACVIKSRKKWSRDLVTNKKFFETKVPYKDIYTYVTWGHERSRYGKDRIGNEVENE